MIYLVFFLSGLSALVYQVAWMKILTVEFGSTVYAVSTVLTVFMAGLALGSWVFGRRADATERPLLLYAVMEAATGFYAVAFVALVPGLQGVYAALEHRFHPSYGSFSLVKLGVAFLLLLLPTTLMGGTLPVLSRHLGLGHAVRANRLALLYSCNTAGAVAGSILFAFWWILALGVRGSILAAAGVNLSLALVSVWIWRRQAAPAGRGEDCRPARGRRVSAQPPDGGGGATRRRRLALGIAFVSGFVVLACEVLWTRLMVTLLSGNALIFATVLAAVLTGLAAGGFVASWLVARLPRLEPLLAGVLLAGGALLAMMVLGQGGLGRVFSAALQSRFGAMPFVVLFLILVGPCAVLGVTFPTLIRWVARGASTVGSDVGSLYAVNTVGAILGSLVSGYLLIGTLGLNASLLLLAAVYAALSVPLLTGKGARGLAAAAVAVIAAALLVPSVRGPRYWYNGGFRQVAEIGSENTAFLEEGVSATVGVARSEGSKHLTVNGIIVANSSRHDLWDLLSKAHLPMLLHPDPKRVALIGLGAGVSLGAVEKYDLDRLVCVELSPEVVRACPQFSEQNQDCLADPRLDLVVNDGRHFLATAQESFDVINVDPVDPPICTLYSQDFFQACFDRLRDGGLMVQWLPVFRLSPGNIQVVAHSFLNVFEHTTVWYNGTALLLVGSKGQPLEVDLRRFVARGRDPRVQSSLEQVGGPDPWMLLSMFVGDGAALARAVPGEAPENTDDHPYLEYAVLRTREAAKEQWVLDMLPRAATPLERCLSPAGMIPEFYTDYARMRAITNAFFRARVLLLRRQPDEADGVVRDAISRYRVTPRELVALQGLFALGGE